MSAETDNLEINNNQTMDSKVDSKEDNTDKQEAEPENLSDLPNLEPGHTPDLTPEQIQEKIEECIANKNKANEFFKTYQYGKAINFYSLAIDEYPVSETIPAAFFSNRSFAYLKNDFPAAALEDANSGIKSDKNFIKNYYRRASANMLLRNFDQALKDFELVHKRRPKDPDAKAKVLSCRKIVQEKRFLKALCSGQNDYGSGSSGAAAAEPQSDFSDYDLEKLKIPDDYKGPRFEEEEITEIDSSSVDETGDDKSKSLATTKTKITPDFCLKLKEYLKDQKTLPKKMLFDIMLKCLKIFKSYDSLVDVKIPENNKMTVCGDTHGQFYDLCHIFELNGEPSDENPYLFNGDFVDRGSYSIEVILTLLAYKACWPDHFHLTRGNHETNNMNELYGFEGECKHKYDNETYKFFGQVFNWLPLSICLTSHTDKKVVVMHGGLFDQTEVSLDDIRKIDRVRQPPESGLMTDILWSDPCYRPGRQLSKRGTSIQFGPDITKKFCDFNKVEYIIRSHEVKDQGYDSMHDNKCYTIFSAPNYCDQMGNKGAYIIISGEDLKPEFKQFSAVPHPNVKPMQYSNMNMLRLAGLMGS